MTINATCLFGGLSAALMLGSPAHASDTTTYAYDPLGRLVGVSTSGGSNNGVAISTSYDAAGNRTSYGVTGVGGLAANSGPAGGDAVRLAQAGGGSGAAAVTNRVSAGYSR